MDCTKGLISLESSLAVLVLFTCVSSWPFSCSSRSRIAANRIVTVVNRCCPSKMQDRPSTPTKLDASWLLTRVHVSRPNECCRFAADIDLVVPAESSNNVRHWVSVQQ